MGRRASEASRLGIGSTLLDLIESRALERLAGVDGALLHHSINDVDEAARAMLIARGYGLVRSFRHMQIDLHGPVHAGEPPPGIQIRGADPTRDLPAIHAVLGEAFVEEWGYDVPPFEIWRAREVQGPGSDPSLWAVATDGGRIVGALTAQIWGDRAWIGELGVLPARRGRGIASALLRRSFSIAADRGVPRAMLNVDFENPAGVIALYEKAGMRPVRGYDVYEKPIG